MKKRPKTKSLKLYDVAAGPMYLIMFGVPLVIIFAIVGLIAFAGKLIEKARARNEEKLYRQYDQETLDQQAKKAPTDD